MCFYRQTLRVLWTEHVLNEEISRKIYTRKFYNQEEALKIYDEESLHGEFNIPRR